MIPLHVHSNYTLLKGTSRIEELIKRAGENQLQMLALTDTNGMYGLVQFAKNAEENGIKPILGSLIDQPNDESVYILLLAKNIKGYEDLCKIITSRKLNDDFDLISLLSKPLNELFIITPSIILLEKFGKRDNVYAELIITERNKSRARNLYTFAKDKGIKVVASNPVYFLDKSDIELHKAVTAIRLNTAIDNLSDDELADSEFYFKDILKLNKIYKNVPEAIRNSEFIAHNCNVDLRLSQYKFPNFAVPKGKDSFSLLWEKCF